MIEDIQIPEVKNVTIAVIQGEVADSPWKVYLLNKNEFPIENTLVSSSGYGNQEGQSQNTSILRHFLETVPANSSVLIEPIDASVFHLTNEYWVSYYVGHQIYDKRFVFVPDTICTENLTYIKELEKEGVLHS